MSSPINRGSFADLLDPELRMVFVEVGQERPVEYGNWVNTPEMDWNPITDKQISGLGAMPSKDEGAQFELDKPIDGNSVSYEAVPYGMAVEITREMFDDDLYGPMREFTRLMAKSSRNRLEVDAHSILNNAFSTTFDGFDTGKSLISASHVLLNGGSAANRPAVDTGLSQSAIQDSLIRFENMDDERGLPVLLSPSVLVISPENRFLARELLGSSLKSGGAENDINALADEGLSVLVSHYLTSTTAWYLLAAKGNHDLNFFIRNQPEFDSFTDPWTGNAVFTVYQRHIAGYGSWKGVDGSSG